MSIRGYLLGGDGLTDEDDAVAGFGLHDCDSAVERDGFLYECTEENNCCQEAISWGVSQFGSRFAFFGSPKIKLRHYHAVCGGNSCRRKPVLPERRQRCCQVCVKTQLTNLKRVVANNPRQMSGCSEVVLADGE
jgi:hypothetical protein